MFRAALLIARKDLRLIFGRGFGPAQALLLGLLLIFLFSLAGKTGEKVSPQAAAAVFWMASAFCQVLIFSTLYGYEEGGPRFGLLCAPCPPQAVWLGKAVAGLLVLLVSQAVFLPASAVFLGQSLSPLWTTGLAMLLLVDVGIAALGSLLGALSQGQSSRESLLGIILFPLLTPLFLAGIRLGAAAFSGVMEESESGWFILAPAFDGIFIAAALVLFPHIYNAEE
jgi:heme exporter protein B